MLVDLHQRPTHPPCSCGSGETLLRGERFEQHLGPLWHVLKDKYSEWLNATYSTLFLRVDLPFALLTILAHEELLRSEGAVNGPPGTRSAASSTPAFTPRQSPGLETVSFNASETSVVTQVQEPPIATLTPASTTDESNEVSLSDDVEVSPASDHHRALFARTWVPAYTPSWLLGSHHGDYVHAAIPYLTAVPGGPCWEDLLSTFVTFESLSSARNVSKFCYRWVPVSC